MLEIATQQVWLARPVHSLAGRVLTSYSLTHTGLFEPFIIDIDLETKQLELGLPSNEVSVYLHLEMALASVLSTHQRTHTLTRH